MPGSSWLEDDRVTQSKGSVLRGTEGYRVCLRRSIQFHSIEGSTQATITFYGKRVMLWLSDGPSGEGRWPVGSYSSSPVALPVPAGGR